MQLEAVEYLEELSEFTFAKTLCDAPITYYVAGYITRGMMNRLKCSDCKSVISDNSCPLTVDVEEIM